MARQRLLQSLLLLACLWAFVVIGLGAYTRLTDAGLGCPDWPGCYGHITVPKTQHAISRAQIHYPTTPLVAHKAWAEMIHRYFAGGLGILILAVIVLAVRLAKQSNNKKILIPTTLLLALLIYQPILGMWTVTLKLLPIIVSQHLLGGISIFAILWLLFLMTRETQNPANTSPTMLRSFAFFAVVLCFIQLALGAWTSTNYAAISCPNFPFCSLQPWHYDLKHAFTLFSPAGMNYDGGILSDNARKTIQMVHRFGALIISTYILALCCTAIFILNQKRIVITSFVTIALLIIQVSLGILNVILARPLLIAVMHNLIATLLFTSTLTLTYFITRNT